MIRRYWGWMVPFITTLMVVGVMTLLAPAASIYYGIVIGLMIALIQSFISVGAMQWSWDRSYFYWIWGGGILVRLLVLFLTAFVVFMYTELSLVATMVSMVMATTLFLVVESAAYLKDS